MFTYEVSSLRKIRPQVVELTLKSLTGYRTIEYEAGQYVAISFTRGFRSTPARCFSITSSPSQKGILQICFRVGGAFTQALSEIEIGAKVSVMGPFGDFVYEDVDDYGAIFLAGGIGITPFMSIIRDMRDSGSTKKVTLIYSCRTQEDTPFLDEIVELERCMPNLEVIFLLGDTNAPKLVAQKVIGGFLTKDLLAKVTNSKPTNYDYYICGPKGLMKNAQKYLKALNVDKDQILTEAFSQTKSTLFANGSGPSLNFFTYGATFVSLIAATLAFTAIDLVRYDARATASSTPSTLAPTSTSTTQTTSSQDMTTSPQTSTVQQQAPQQNYSQPVSTVS